METIPSDPQYALDREAILVDLALQGGGSHGAFTWGYSIGFSRRPGSRSKVFPAPGRER
jgi:hypothetical protein